MKKNDKKILLSILIPVRNEKIHIKIMIKILTSVLEFPHEVLIICDSQKDESVPIVESLMKQYPQLKLVINKRGVGVTNALMAGVAKSQGEYLLIFVTDDMGPVLAIEDMIELMKKGCDLVSATRYAHGGKRIGGSKIQAVLSKTGNYFFRLLVGTALTDSTTGIKMFRKDFFNKITLESKVGWAVVFEIAIKAQLYGMRLGEIPIISIDRLYGGKSTFKTFPWLREYIKWFVYGIQNLHSKRKKMKVAVRVPRNIL